MDDEALDPNILQLVDVFSSKAEKIQINVPEYFVVRAHLEPHWAPEMIEEQLMMYEWSNSFPISKFQVTRKYQQCLFKILDYWPIIQ